MALRLLIASLLLVVGAAGAARADDRNPVAIQLEAEALEKDAKATRDFAKYVECGKAYLAIADRMAGARATDEMLYNAGVCFEEGKEIGLALQMFARIMKEYARSKIAPKAMARSAMLYMDAANYERAAELLEKYAKMYAGEKDAFYAASDAAFLYRGIGNRAKWIEITMFFVKAFGTKRPAEAGEAWFALTAAYDGDYESQRKHLLEYLRRYSARDNDRALIAAAKLGDLMWAKSCRVNMTNGLCVAQPRRNGPAPKRCGTSVVVDEVVVARDEKLMKEALVHYYSAVKRHEQVGGKTSPAATSAAANAMVAIADRNLEAMMAVPLPNALELGAEDGKVRERSQKRFADWLDMQTKAGTAVVARYQDVMARGDPAAILAALHRMAQASEWMWKQLDGAQLPKQRSEVHCAALRDVAEPLRLTAKSAFLTCSAKAAELTFYPVIAEVCLRRLEAMDPELFPRMMERVARPLAAGTVLAVESPM